MGCVDAIPRVAYIWGAQMLRLPFIYCPMPSTYRFVIIGPVVGRRVDTVTACNQSRAAATLLRVARIWDAAAEVAPLLEPCPFG